jgi:hypothetical protein
MGIVLLDDRQTEAKILADLDFSMVETTRYHGPRSGRNRNLRIEVSEPSNQTDVAQILHSRDAHSFTLRILEGMHPGVHHVVESHPLLDLAVRKLVVLPVTLRNPLTFLVVQCEAVGPFRDLDKRRLSHRGFREINSVNIRPIGRRGEQTNKSKLVHDELQNL